MKRMYSFVGVAVTVALLVSACSQAPVAEGVEPQFGSPRDDRADVVATDVRQGRIYVGGSYYNAYDNNPTNRGDVVFFRRYDRSGKLIWKVSANTEKPNVGASVEDVITDRTGNVYFAWNTYSTNDNPFNEGFISKLSPTGRRLFQKRLVAENIRGLASDTSGNIYATSRSNHIRKYSGGGKLVWDKVLADQDFPNGYGGSISDIEASTDGSLYVAGANEGDYGGLLFKLRRSDGKVAKVVGTKGDAALEVKVSGSSIYVYSFTDGICFDPIVSKFRPDGSEVWSRSGVLEEINENGGLDYRCDDWSSLGVDSKGNAYLAGSFIDENYDSDLFVRKYTPSGKTAFNRRFKKTETDSYGSGVATIGENELYVIGSTDGSVDDKNNGGRDAYLLRLDNQAQKVWIR